ncbi:hypothetical protein LCM4576_14505 [Mesorhizobium sp. LCM 4576]|nr:hypothetical protein LCM4576_14505 [Mesorhizobium sp. LCM 4576]
MQGALSESETFLDSWTLVMGLLFVLVVLFLPKGIAGAVETITARFERRCPAPAQQPQRTDAAGAGTHHLESLP